MLESKTYIATPPGATLKEQLTDRGMTQKEFAKRMGMSEKHISRLINGDVHLTPDTAEKIELVLGVPASFWNKLEAIYQEKIAKIKIENELAAEAEQAKKYPYNKLVEWGMIPPAHTWQEKIINLCKYFEVSNLNLLQTQDLMPQTCNKPAATEKSTCTIQTLTQYAKIKARNIQTAPYNANTLKKEIETIRTITRKPIIKQNTLLEDTLKNCGIALIYLPKINNNTTQSITFYDHTSNKIVLGITIQTNTAKFQFNLFHEIAHILKGHIHQKTGTTETEEKEANKIAEEILEAS